VSVWQGIHLALFLGTDFIILKHKAYLGFNHNNFAGIQLQMSAKFGLKAGFPSFFGFDNFMGNSRFCRFKLYKATRHLITIDNFNKNVKNYLSVLL
jgi:hypothetical protein